MEPVWGELLMRLVDVAAAYLLIGLVWSSVVLFRSRGDGSSDSDKVIMFTAMIPLWPLAAFVVIPDVVTRGVTGMVRFFASGRDQGED